LLSWENFSTMGKSGQARYRISHSSQFKSFETAAVSMGSPHGKLAGRFVIGMGRNQSLLLYLPPKVSQRLFEYDNQK
jgi:hypothetical protein